MATSSYIKKRMVTRKPVTSKDALQVAGNLPQKFFTAVTPAVPARHRTDLSNGVLHNPNHKLAGESLVTVIIQSTARHIPYQCYQHGAPIIAA
jgi:hypothetical protein